MKHYSPVELERSAQRASAPPRSAARETDGEGEVRAALWARLSALGDKAALARELGLKPLQLTGMLRGHWPVSDAVAEALGYRKIVRFERID